MLPTYNPIEHLPPPTDLFPTLRLVPDPRQAPGGANRYRAHLSRALVAALRLCPNQPIDLLAPSAHHPYWHLDLRPQASRRLAWYADTRPRINYLLLPAGILGEQPDSLVLCLVPGDPAFPGFYPLLPSTYFTPKS